MNLSKIWTNFDRYMGLPALFMVFVMIMFPIVYSLYMSLQMWTGSSFLPPLYVGLDNYRDLLFHNVRFWNSVWRSFYFTGLTLVGQMVLGVTMALAFNRKFPGRGVVRTLFLLPIMATPVAVSLTWSLMFDPSIGLLNYFLELLGLPPSLWVADAKWVLPSLALVDIWKWTPLVMLITLAGLATLPQEPYESAIIDGASGFQILRFITLPLLRPVLVVAGILRTVDSFKTFDIIYVITMGGPGLASEILNIYAYSLGLRYQQIGYASSVLIVFYFIIMSVAGLLIRLRRRETV